MSEKLVGAMIGAFGGLTSIAYGKEILVFIISLLPILELRGGLLAAALIGLDPVKSYIISIIGNVLPVPFILLLITKILVWMKKSKIKFLNKFASWLDEKVEKHKGQIEKFGYLGIILFVGIPLPGTGAWTGSLIASVLNMDKKKTFLAVLVGIFMASIIMMLVSFGFLANVIH
ncbi:small multi-drug export protein [uncultured Clostridium sp.]|uniref:COG2426 family protein n=1 Tax=uncultured Clostridium sp. TaxID=59620 RepID=UPI0026F26E15|nr:small multi-drug export protein [uncultured Clostridium sp.]